MHITMTGSTVVIEPAAIEQIELATRLNPVVDPETDSAYNSIGEGNFRRQWTPGLKRPALRQRHRVLSLTFRSSPMARALSHSPVANGPADSLLRGPLMICLELARFRLGRSRCCSSL